MLIYSQPDVEKTICCPSNSEIRGDVPHLLYDRRPCPRLSSSSVSRLNYIIAIFLHQIVASCNI